MTMDPAKCVGCSNDFYNGKNDLGVKRCWSLDTAKVQLRRRVGVNDVPPWTRKSEPLPSCYRQSGFIFVAPDVSC